MIEEKRDPFRVVNYTETRDKIIIWFYVSDDWKSFLQKFKMYFEGGCKYDGNYKTWDIYSPYTRKDLFMFCSLNNCHLCYHSYKSFKKKRKK